jgi:transglutaminase-like putative cysteine protease
VQVSGAAANEAFYLRTTILESYTGKAWVQGSPAPTVPATSDNYTVAPANVTSDSNTSQFNATISIAKLGATPPLFATPSALSNIPSSWAWSQRYGILAGNVKAGQTYVETVEQPDPSRAQLEAASAGPASLGGPGRSVLQQNLATVDVPSVVNDLVSKITAGKSSPYDKAEALSSYFTNPANGFIYSLQTRAGESGNDLVDFLTTGKAGFCQQYAAALGVMLRVAGIPARVVLGYTHPAPDSHGQFLVTSDDAHAWVEAYFNGIGWVPFDPTPLVGVDAARAVALPWAPHPTSVTASDPAAPRPGLDLAGKDPQSSGNLTSSSSNNANDSGLLAAWLGAAAFVVLLILAALTPFLLRVRLRRRRLHQSAQIGPEPAWAELAATARDLELGWSDARSPRQVVSWLGEMVLSAPPRAALRELAGGIERARYAGAGHDESGDRTRWADAAEQVSRELRAVSPRAVRLRARFLPHSLRTSAEDGETSRPDTRERVGSDRA